MRHISVMVPYSQREKMAQRQSHDLRSFQTAFKKALKKTT